MLDELEANGKIATTAAAGLRLLMLTGCRRNEILTLRWEDVDLEHDEIRLRDAKTGARAVPLSPTARQVLISLPRQPDNPWVISGRGPGARLSNLNATWGVDRKKAGLEDVRIHDLRHSFASRALSLGGSLPIMGLLKNPSSDRGECRTMRQRPLGGWFGCWGPDGLLRVPFRRLGVPRWPTGRHEGRRQAA